MFGKDDPKPLTSHALQAEPLDTPRNAMKSAVHEWGKTRNVVRSYSLPAFRAVLPAASSSLCSPESEFLLCSDHADSGTSDDPSRQIAPPVRLHLIVMARDVDIIVGDVS